eukprot:scaffold7168_cov102-Isochrysis_galbana.AAC.1
MHCTRCGFRQARPGAARARWRPWWPWRWWRASNTHRGLRQPGGRENGATSGSGDGGIKQSRAASKTRGWTQATSWGSGDEPGIGREGFSFGLVRGAHRLEDAVRLLIGEKVVEGDEPRVARVHLRIVLRVLRQRPFEDLGDVPFGNIWPLRWVVRALVVVVGRAGVAAGVEHEGGVLVALARLGPRLAARVRVDARQLVAGVAALGLDRRVTRAGLGRGAAAAARPRIDAARAVHGGVATSLLQQPPTALLLCLARRATGRRGAARRGRQRRAPPH